ncbi:hypothetical protein CYLTODRAFT_426949 [Cylindrobasidium torrendii FP15055 ss-10]|uniref:Uncharacterized protein n=1 Tax=Cylindrobasidium torrendii FP15055 ss-10 TaxID=1314674 RepID=A0A0D7AW19_9AGAR|nr:hypothetical protein CYLTODRAFT_426949 [Cylindrobasidium torrendii FP15055 ss-10]
MGTGELIKYMHAPGNYLYLQRDFGANFSSRGQAFVPLDETLQTILDTYCNNQQYPHEDRARIKVDINTLECTLVDTFLSVEQPIFLRHPITGIVTKHEHPYPAFPTIRLRTADPALIAATACLQLIARRKAPNLLQQLEHVLRSFSRNAPPKWFSRPINHVSLRPPVIPAPSFDTDSPRAPSSRVVRSVAPASKPLAVVALPRLRKRQRDTVPSEECPSAKRNRGKFCVPARRNPARAAKTVTREGMTPFTHRRRGI